MELKNELKGGEKQKGEKMGLLGRGKWILGISVATKWKILPFSFALFFFFSGLITRKVDNILISFFTLLVVIWILRKV